MYKALVLQSSIIYTPGQFQETRPLLFKTNSRDSSCCPGTHSLTVALPWPFTKSTFSLPLFLQNLIEHDPFFFHLTGMYLTSRNKLPEIKNTLHISLIKCNFPCTAEPRTHLGSGGKRDSNISLFHAYLRTHLHRSHIHIFFTLVFKLTFPMSPYWSKRKVSNLKIHFAPTWMRWMAA